MKKEWMNLLLEDLRSSKKVEFFNDEELAYPEISTEIKEAYINNKGKIVIVLSDDNEVFITDELEFVGKNEWFDYKSYVFSNDFKIVLD